MGGFSISTKVSALKLSLANNRPAGGAPRVFEPRRNPRAPGPTRGASSAAAAPHPLAGIAVVSFDVDGTLYPDRALPRLVVAEALRRALAGRPAEAWRDLAGLARFRREAEAARAAGGRLGPSWKSGLAGRRGREARLLVPVIGRIGPAPGLVAVLNRLRPLVAALAAVSDFAPEARIAALGLSGRFDHIYAAETLGALKPDPRVFRRVVDDLGIPPAALLHLGNRPETDGRAATAAGCRVRILGKDFSSFGELLETFSSPWTKQDGS